MASVHLKAGSRNWHAYYRDHTGRLRSKSTKQTVRSKAIRIAEAWEKIAQRKLAAAEVKEATNQLVRQIYKDEVPFASVGTFFEQWFRLKAPEIAESTLASYRKSADKFLAFPGDAANGDIAAIKKHRIAEFRNHLLEKVSPQTANIDLKFVRTVFRAAKADGYVSESPAENVELFRRVNTRTRRTFSIEQLRQVIEVAEPEWRSMVRFGLYTGQRMGDLARLTWSNIDLDRGIIRLKASKTGRFIVIPIAPPLRAHIIAIEIGSSADPIHPQCSRKQSNQLSNEFADLLARAGLRQPRKHVATGRRHTLRSPSELSFHCLRHTAATLLEQAGIARAVVQGITGHSSDQMSELYTHVGLEALQQAALALPAL